MHIHPYLVFGGRCEEALNFYTAALGAKVEALMRFSDGPFPPPPGCIADNWGNKIMHSSIRVGDAQFMASDGGKPLDTKFEGFSMSLSVPDEATANRFFAGLSTGGQVTMPLTKTFFSPCFGMVTDQFGLSWMIIVLPPSV